jgi:crotonobetainyl-CoA:carnitine CoA-transferase CaiB-like acyl-CoA transferase
MTGVRVVEVANWTFVPAAGAILADLGADVIKVEPPTGDPQRGLQNLLNFGADGPNPFVEIPNRGKRSIALDLTNESGRELLLRIAERSDVLLTSTLAPIRAKLRIDVDDIRAANPDIIYVRGTGWGSAGPMADAGGFDLACGWAAGGLAYKLTGDGEPPFQPPAFYDLQGANTIAGAIACALFKRERTGTPSVVDVSLLNVAMWSMAPDIVGAPYAGSIPVIERTSPGNPISNSYQTKDGRWLFLVCLQSDRYWAELCTCLGCTELIDDPPFADATARYEHRTECVAALDRVFAAKTLDDVRRDLAEFSGVWSPVQTPIELHEHPQVEANGYLPEIQSNAGVPFRLVAPPAQFDGAPIAPQGAAPELCQHTEEVLLDIGLTWEDITAFRDTGALGT